MRSWKVPRCLGTTWHHDNSKNNDSITNENFADDNCNMHSFFTVTINLLLRPTLIGEFFLQAKKLQNLFSEHHSLHHRLYDLSEWISIRDFCNQTILHIYTHISLSHVPCRLYMLVSKCKYGTIIKEHTFEKSITRTVRYAYMYKRVHEVVAPVRSSG